MLDDANQNVSNIPLSSITTQNETVTQTLTRLNLTSTLTPALSVTTQSLVNHITTTPQTTGAYHFTTQTVTTVRYTCITVNMCIFLSHSIRWWWICHFTLGGKLDHVHLWWKNCQMPILICRDLVMHICKRMMHILLPMMLT